jgi:hypothetical protein
MLESEDRDANAPVSRICVSFMRTRSSFPPKNTNDLQGKHHIILSRALKLRQRICVAFCGKISEICRVEECSSMVQTYITLKCCDTERTPRTDGKKTAQYAVIVDYSEPCGHSAGERGEKRVIGKSMWPINLTRPCICQYSQALSRNARS